MALDPWRRHFKGEKGALSLKKERVDLVDLFSPHAYSMAQIRLCGRSRLG